MAPTICVPGIPQLMYDFGVTSDTLQTLAVTIYVLGLAIGPMVISPLSETYGRLPIYHATNLAFVSRRWQRLEPGHCPVHGLPFHLGLCRWYAHGSRWRHHRGYYFTCSEIHRHGPIQFRPIDWTGQ